jgi:mono/diheme cytochrome c family protein
MNRISILLLLIGCGSPRMSEPIAGPLPAFNQQEARGEIVFMRKCNMCHPQGEGGLGGALNSKPFPGTMIKAKVRGLVPGDMPKFGDQDIPDGDVDALAAYLKKIRKNDND